MRLPSAQSIGYLAPPDQRLRDLARDAIARRAVDDDDRERLLAMLGLHDMLDALPLPGRPDGTVL